MDNLIQRLASQGIYAPGSPELLRFESDVARFLGREYARIAATPDEHTPVVADQGPMWCQTDRLMERHYDANLPLFQAFLDRRYMAYSMAYYDEGPEAIRCSPASLEEAQRAKLSLLADRARIRGDERILDIGCGFGSLETYLTEVFPDVRVTAITPSTNQTAFIRNCIRRPGHPLAGTHLQLLQGDFATVPLESEGYDVVISVGAFEHVQNLSLAMAKVATLLRPGGICLLDYICSSLPIPRFLDSRRSLIDEYFPGGRIWPYSALADHTAGLELEQAWFLNGLNYWRTIDAWHHNLWEDLPDIFETSPNTEDFGHWNQYFSLCKACFAPADGRVLGNGQFRLRKPH